MLRYWIGSLEEMYFKRVLQSVKRSIEEILTKVGLNYAKSEPLHQLCLFMERLYEINEMEKILSFTEFYIKATPSADQESCYQVV